MKKYLLSIFILLCFLLSCENNDDTFSKDNIVQENKPVVVKERDSDIPWVPSNYKLKNSTKSLKASIGFPQVKYLGNSYKNNYYPIQDARNMGNPVIDYDKFRKAFPSYFRSWKIVSGEASRFSYAYLNNYTSKSTITKEVNGGFSLNLGLFSIGNKENRKTVFTNNITENSNAVYGELNIVIRDSAFNMQVNSNILQKIKMNYLHQDFKDNLYNLHPSEFFTDYGGIVLANFVTGGKATALYTGIYKKSESSANKESNMDREIDSSFKFGVKKDDDGLVSGDMKLGNVNNNVSITKEFSSILMSVKTLGGSGEFGSFSTSKEVKETNIDLSKWAASLSNKSNNTIIEFGENGLIPIINFIPEYNLKQQIKNYLANGVNKIERLQEPYISISRIIGSGTNMIIDFAVLLHTRFGDEIILKYDLLHGSMLDAYIEQEIKRYSKMFGLKIINGSNYPYNPPYNVSKEIVGIVSNKIFDEELLKKCTINGVLYIISDFSYGSNSNGIIDDGIAKRKYAYSIHDDKVLDEYAMRALVNRLPTTNISLEKLLKEYLIMAL